MATDHRGERIRLIYQAGYVIRLRDLVPAGYYLCCLCLEAIPVDMLWIDDTGVRWDICEPCHLAELRAMGLL
jgi:hypothetical protein